MRYRATRRFTTKRLLAVLLVVSVVGLLLPTRITARLMNLVQVLVPLQDAATRTADGAGRALTRRRRQPTWPKPSCTPPRSSTPRHPLCWDRWTTPLVRSI